MVDITKYEDHCSITHNNIGFSEFRIDGLASSEYGPNYSTGFDASYNTLDSLESIEQFILRLKNGDLNSAGAIVTQNNGGHWVALIMGKDAAYWADSSGISDQAAINFYTKFLADKGVGPMYDISRFVQIQEDNFSCGAHAFTNVSVVRNAIENGADPNEVRRAVENITPDDIHSTYDALVISRDKYHWSSNPHYEHNNWFSDAVTNPYQSYNNWDLLDADASSGSYLDLNQNQYIYTKDLEFCHYLKNNYNSQDFYNCYVANPNQSDADFTNAYTQWCSGMNNFDSQNAEFPFPGNEGVNMMDASEYVSFDFLDIDSDSPSSKLTEIILTSFDQVIDIF